MAWRSSSPSSAMARRAALDVVRTVRRWLEARGEGRRDAPPGEVRLGDLRRLTPISAVWGYDRGLPIDRYYIERFLARHAADVHGRVLEIGDDAYTRRFGGASVLQRDVLDVSAANERATIVADLARADHVPSNSFDCVILTQTLQLVYDVPAALAAVYRILRSRGVVLATLPGITRISHREWAGSWFWAFTSFSARRLFAAVFPTEAVRVESHGNVLAACAFLYGLAVEEMSQEELDYADPDYELSITVRAVKA
jgi:SAM-dependent methyltransferase